MGVSAASMLARVSKLEQLHISPILKRIGSLKVWERMVVDSIEAGTLCSTDGPHLFHAVRRWTDAPYQSPHPLLVLAGKDAPVIPIKPEPSVPVIAVPTNTQADHERAYQQFRRNKPEGVRQYLQAKEQQVKDATR